MEDSRVRPSSFTTEDVIRDVSVLTCNRPLLLERCLSSLRASGSEATALRLRVLDDGTNANPGHVTRSDRREIARRLAAAAGVDEALAVFAVCPTRDAGPAIGAVRNTALLLNAGRKHLQVDDDAICTPYVAPDADERRLVLAREDSHVRLQWFPTGAAPLDGLAPARDGFVEAHQRILGRSLADLARENEFDTMARGAAQTDARPGPWSALRVRVTQNSLAGDCGITGPWWKTLRTSPWTPSEGESYRAELLSREVRRTVDAIAISRLLAPTAFAMGIDGTRLVPPFLPCGRGEDALFVFLLNLIDPQACQAQLPAVAQHRPEARAPFPYSAIVESVTHLSVPTIFNLLFATPAGRPTATATLESAGASLLHLFRTGWKSAGEELLPAVLGRRRATLQRIEAVLDGAAAMPDARRNDLREQADRLRRSVEQASPATLIDDIAAAQPELCTETAIAGFLRQFGELLQVWGDLWSAAAAMELDAAASTSAGR